MIKKKIKVKKLQGTPYLISESEVLGTGCFGNVVKAYKKDQPQKQLVAKIIPLSNRNVESIQSEIKILKSIPNHANLVNCEKYIISSSNNFYLIMEYCNGGSFQKYIQQHYYCSQELIWRFLKEFCKGYQVLYNLHIIHRDIKPQNILIHNSVFKIADFGFSRKLYHHNIQQNLSIKGTPLYMAPQIQADGKGSSKVDVFSFGVVLFRLAYNKFPYYKSDQIFQTLEAYFSHLKKAPLNIPSYPKRSNQFEQLIKKMLQKDSQSRISWKDIFEHPKVNIRQIKHNEQNQVQQISRNLDLDKFRKSIVQINKSSAHIKQIKIPYDLKQSIQSETQQIIQFTRSFTNLDLKSLQMYIIRRKVMIELILHLNKIIDTIQLPQIIKRKKYIQRQIKSIQQKGNQYCHYHLQTIKKIIIYHCQTTELSIKDNIKDLIQDLGKQIIILQQILTKKTKKVPTFQHLGYENTLYDFLSESVDWQIQVFEQLKISIALMIDIYDASLKMESMARILEDGRVQMVQIQLQDAQLDRIDYTDISTYKRYLQQINQVTIQKVHKSLKKMGLLFQ